MKQTIPTKMDMQSKTANNIPIPIPSDSLSADPIEVLLTESSISSELKVEVGFLSSLDMDFGAGVAISLFSGDEQELLKVIVAMKENKNIALIANIILETLIPYFIFKRAHS